MKSNLKIAIFYILLIGVIIITSTALLQNIPAENVTSLERGAVGYFGDAWRWAP